MTPHVAAALEALALRLQECGVPFLLGGSALLHAVGLDVPVGDLDLMARGEDRAALESAAAPWWRATTTTPTPLFRSPWKAELDVHGVAVDVIGGLAYRAGGRTVRVPFREEGRWRCGAAEVPLAPAAHWLLLYEAYKPERAARLAAALPQGARERALAEVC